MLGSAEHALYVYYVRTSAHSNHQPISLGLALKGLTSLLSEPSVQIRKHASLQIHIMSVLVIRSL